MTNQVATLGMEQKFKKTPAGIIPIDWEVTTFGESFQFLRTANNSRSDLNTTDIVGYIHYGDIHTKWRTTLRCDQVELPKIKPSKVANVPRLQNGDLVMADASEDYDGLGVSVEVSNVGNRHIVAGLHTLLLRDKGGQFSESFRGYIQNIPAVRQRLIEAATGVSVYGLSKGRLANVPIPRPPLEEQRKIAEILSAVDNALEKADVVIEWTKKLKTGLTQQLLTQGIGHKKFKKTAIGDIPLGWVVESLRTVCVSSAFGPRFSSSQYDRQGNVATLRTTDIDDDGNINFETMPVAKLAEMDFKDHFLRSNDLLITRSGTCGIAAVFSRHHLPVLPGAFLIRFRLSQNMAPHFLRLYFNSRIGRRRLLALAAGGVQKNLNSVSLLNLQLPLPPRPEQEKIVQRILELENTFRSLQQHKSKLELLKNAVMQLLLTGRVRV